MKIKLITYTINALLNGAKFASNKASKLKIFETGEILYD